MFALVISLFWASPVIAETAGQGPARFERKVSSLIEEINSKRKQLNVGRLKRSMILEKAAMSHSHDMAKNGNVTHNSSDGLSFKSRMRKQGVRMGVMAENIGCGASEPETILKEWLNSQEHRVNMLDRQYRFVGVGVAFHPEHRCNWFWTAIFAAE